MKNGKKVLKYKSYTDDFFDDGVQHTLPEDYAWVREDARSRFLSKLVYGAAIAFSQVFLRIFHGISIKGAKNQRKACGGYFIYGNHTQHFADVFIPALAALPKRIYTVVGAANMDLPGIGKILPYLGALPLPNGISGMRGFSAALKKRLETGHPIVIYPEAHVWDYCTFIRPFPKDSFGYPVKYGKPVFAMTSTYQKRRFVKRPKITVYIDGPFYTPTDLSSREKAQWLRDKVFDVMVERSALSSCEYIKYEKE